MSISIGKCNQNEVCNVSFEKKGGMTILTSKGSWEMTAFSPLEYADEAVSFWVHFVAVAKQIQGVDENIRMEPIFSHNLL